MEKVVRRKLRWVAAAVVAGGRARGLRRAGPCAGRIHTGRGRLADRAGLRGPWRPDPVGVRRKRYGQRLAAGNPVRPGLAGFRDL